MDPAGMIYVVDPSPLNWFYITLNTLGEPTMADPLGRLAPLLLREAHWLDPLTLEAALPANAQFHDGTPLSSARFIRNFVEMQQWAAPHPPGTWLNLHLGTTCEAITEQAVRFRFPEPDGLALFKLQALHVASPSFWNQIGFGYALTGSGEGRW